MWATLRSDTSRPFPKPGSGRVAVKVINHLGDEAMKVITVQWTSPIPGQHTRPSGAELSTLTEPRPPTGQILHMGPPTTARTLVKTQRDRLSALTAISPATPTPRRGTTASNSGTHAPTDQDHNQALGVQGCIWMPEQDGNFSSCGRLQHPRGPRRVTLTIPVRRSPVLPTATRLAGRVVGQERIHAPNPLPLAASNLFLLHGYRRNSDSRFSLEHIPRLPHRRTSHQSGCRPYPGSED